jgi:uncharacterized protein YbjT (DUF2867 family)
VDVVMVEADRTAVGSGTGEADTGVEGKTRASEAAGAAASPSGSIAVAGASGFVGGAIAAELDRRGRSIVALTRTASGSHPDLPETWRTVVFDVTRDGQPLPTGLAGMVIAVTFRGYPMENPRRRETFAEVDAGGTERLVAAAQAAGVGRLVYISGAGAAPDAPRHWFRAKWRSEEAVRGSGIPWTIIRPTWLYGPGDAALNRFLTLGRWLPFVPMPGDGRSRVAPVYIGDLAVLVADALDSAQAIDQVFELGGPQTLTLDEVVRHALAADGRRRPILHAPAGLMKLAAWPLQYLPRPPLTPDAIDFVNQPAVVDPGPLLARLPRRLTPLDEGLATYLGRRR